MSSPSNRLSQSTLISSLINDHLSTPIKDEDLLLLSKILGPSMLNDALELIDRNEVAKLNLPNRHSLYQVSGTNTAYTVHLHPRPDAIRLGYCPCPAFTYSVLVLKASIVVSSLRTLSPHIKLKKAGYGLIRLGLGGFTSQCKHVLAVLLAERLRVTVDKQVGVRWLAAYSTGFRSSSSTTTTSTTTTTGGGARTME